VLDRDYFSVPDNQIKSISSVLTIMNGKVMFGAQEYVGLSPQLPAILPTLSIGVQTGPLIGAQKGV